MSLGENIIRLRGEKNLSQEKLAIELGVSRQAISKWETDASVPELDKLLRMSEVFGVTLDALVKGDATAEEAQSRNEAAPVQQTIIVERRSTPLRVTLGILSLCFGALLLFALLLLYGAADLWAVFFFVTPFLLCGVLALAVKRYTPLVIGWTLWIFFRMTVVCLTGIQLSLRSLLYAGGVSRFVSWIFLLSLAALTFGTIRAIKNRKK